MASLGWRPNLDGHHDVALDLLLHVNRRTERMLAQTASRLEQATDPEAVRKHQRRVREAVLAGIGGLPDRQKGPPRTRWRGPREALGCVVEHLVYESLPGVPVTATLYRPLGLAGPRPAVFFACGHTLDGRAGPVYQSVCARLARAGMVVLAIDPFGQGERLGYLDTEGRPQVLPSTIEHSYAGIPAWLLGQSTIRWFVTDAMRGIDLLASLPDVDPERIGVTGNSGGGTLITWLLPLEDRIAAAAPGTFVTSRGSYLWSGQHQDAEQILPGGTTNGVDHADLLVTMAPRPLAVLAVDFDYFPMEGTVDTYQRTRAAYRALGAEDAVELHTEPFPHGYAPPLADHAARFFAAAFDLPEPADDQPVAALPPEAMRASRSGQVALDEPDARFLHDLIRSEAELIQNPAPDAAQAWLGERVRAHRRPPTAPYARWLAQPEGHVHGMWRSERDLWGAGILMPGGSHAGSGPRALRILLNDGGAEVLSDDGCGGDPRPEVVLALDVRGRGALAPRDKDQRDPKDHMSVVYKLMSDLLWLDDSLAMGQAFDVIRAIDVVLADQYLGQLYPGLGVDSPVHLEASGVMAFIAKIVAAVDDRVATVTVSDDLVNPGTMLSQRLYSQDRGEWQTVVFGLARHAPLPVLHQILGQRLVVGDQCAVGQRL